MGDDTPEPAILVPFCLDPHKSLRIGSKDRIIGAPSWVWNDSYEFIGKVSELTCPIGSAPSSAVSWRRTRCSKSCCKMLWQTDASWSSTAFRRRLTALRSLPQITDNWKHAVLSG
jgi:hypothetical protein